MNSRTARGLAAIFLLSSVLISSPTNATGALISLQPYLKCTSVTPKNLILSPSLFPRMSSFNVDIESESGVTEPVLTLPTTLHIQDPVKPKFVIMASANDSGALPFMSLSTKRVDPRIEVTHIEQVIIEARTIPQALKFMEAMTTIDPSIDMIKDGSRVRELFSLSNSAYIGLPSDVTEIHTSLPQAPYLAIAGVELGRLVEIVELYGHRALGLSQISLVVNRAAVSLITACAHS